MSDWITDRRPTEDDAVHFSVLIWDEERKQVLIWAFDGVNEGQPWQPIPRPAPYVKPKRWTVEWDNLVALWCLRQNGERYGRLPYTGLPNEAAQRICDIYNEVLP